jgi:hypothetical protein
VSISRAIGERYRRASKEEKGVMLREFCAVCGYYRKPAIRLLNGKKRIDKKKSGLSRPYGAEELTMALKRLWLATDQMCSKKLVAAIPLWLSFYEQGYGRLSGSRHGPASRTRWKEASFGVLL